MTRMKLLRFVIFTVIGCMQLQSIFCTEGKDNKGRHFIFGFMYNYPTAVPEVFITTDCSCTVTVNVSAPLFDPNFFQTFTLYRHQVLKVTLNRNLQGGPGTVFSNKGIDIISDEEIAVFAVNKEEFTTDAFTAFPLDTLGNYYYVITWHENAEFMIIATEEQTTVDILIADGTSITYNNVTYTTGMTLTLTMNMYQTFHVFGGQDYTGTRITTDKPITVVSGASCTWIGGGACDHVSSQMTPVETFGKKFATIYMPNCNRLINFKIVASENNTVVDITGRAPVILSQPGDRYLFQNFNLSLLVSSTKPIAIAFFAPGGCGLNKGDPAMLLLQPTEQFAADYTFTTIDYPTNPFEHSLTIVISESEIPGLRLDGQNILTTWSPVYGSENLRITDFSVTKGAHTIYHVNPIVTFLAVSTGIADFNSYGYSSGQRLAPINSNCTPSVTVPGDIIDNDCDGLIDEELQDGTDNDGDGEIDEDLAKPFEEFNTTTTSTTSTSTTTPEHTTTTIETPTTLRLSTSTELPPTTTPRHSTTTPTRTTPSYIKDIVDENLSTDMVIAGVLSSLFALSCLSTAVYFLKRKLQGKNGQVEDVFSSISSHNIPPVHKTVQNKP